MPASGRLAAVQRYRSRLLVMRLRHTRADKLDVLNLVLAVIGAWSVLSAAARVLPWEGPWWTGGFWVIAVGAVSGLYWLRFTRRPQDIFRLASRSEESAHALRARMTTGMQNDGAFAALAAHYGPLVEELRRRPGFEDLRWPTDDSGEPALVVTLAPRGDQDLDAVVGSAQPSRSAEWAHRASSFAAERQMLMTTLRRNALLGSTFGDEQGQNLVLDRLHGGSAIGLDVATASYGQIVRTSDALINEFALFGHLLETSAIRGRRSPLTLGAAAVTTVLPWRRAVESWDPGPEMIIAPQGRAAGLGVAVVLHDRRGDQLSALVARRSANVGTYPDALHVIPAGMVNVRSPAPFSGDLEVRTLPRLTALAEFLEECFDVEELAGHTLADFAGRVDAELRDRGLQDLRPVFTGVAVDLLNLRVEICATIDVSGREEVLRQFVVSWEFSHHEPLRRVNLRPGAAVAPRRDFVQSGLGALDLASRHLQPAQAAGA